MSFRRRLCLWVGVGGLGLVWRVCLHWRRLGGMFGGCGRKLLFGVSGGRLGLLGVHCWDLQCFSLAGCGVICFVVKDV